MQLLVKLTLSHDNQKVQKDMTFLLSDTPLTIVMEALKQHGLMQAGQDFTIEPNHLGLKLGDQVWQVRHGGKFLDLLQSLLVMPEAQQAGAAGLALEVLPVVDESASLKKELEQLRLAKQSWDKLAQEYEKRLADQTSKMRELDRQVQERENQRLQLQQQVGEQAAKIKQLEARPAAAPAGGGGGALSARRELDQLKQDLQNRQQEWDLQKQDYEQQIATLKARSGGGAAPAHKGMVLQTEALMGGGDQPADHQQWETDRQEYEKIIAELQDKIAELEQALQNQAASAANAPITGDEASEIEKQLQQKHAEIEEDMKKLEQERASVAQEREELQAMENEFRNMEVKTSRERAEMNRQKADFQKLQRQFDFLLSQATKKPDIEKAMLPVMQLREQIRKSTGQ